MLLEDILLVVAATAVILFVGAPIVRLWKAANLRRRDPLAEARERLRVAKVEAEAARLNREADEIYEHLYDETLDRDEATTEKGKAHGKE
jgi:uncharacterized membrane protein